MLCSLTLYKALKKKYPVSRITLVAAKTNYKIPFFDINPDLDRVLIFDKSSFKKIFTFIKNLRNRKYQIGIVPSTIVLSRTSHIINFISGAKKRVGVRSIDGIKNKSHKYLNVKSDFVWKLTHQTERNLQVVNQVDCGLLPEEINSIKINFTKEDLNYAKAFYSNNFPIQNKPVIAFHPGAGKEANVWDKKYFVELIKKLYNAFDNYVLITSGWTDNKIVEPICKELTSANINYKVLHNAEVKKLGAVLTLTNVYITNDTGTMHIAGYSGASLISLFGPTNPKEWAPRGTKQKYIKAINNNINSITVNTVFELAKTFLIENNK
jgi:ADP-heptose:LPS heptosyltransferase